MVLVYHFNDSVQDCDMSGVLAGTAILRQATEMQSIMMVDRLDRLMQDCGISSASAVEILEHCGKPSIWWKFFNFFISDFGVSWCGRVPLNLPVTLLMLETEYCVFRVNTMPADALAPKVAKNIRRHVISCVGQTSCIVVPELMSST